MLNQTDLVKPKCLSTPSPTTNYAPRALNAQCEAFQQTVKTFFLGKDPASRPYQTELVKAELVELRSWPRYALVNITKHIWNFDKMSRRGLAR